MSGIGYAENASGDPKPRAKPRGIAGFSHRAGGQTHSGVKEVGYRQNNVRDERGILISGEGSARDVYNACHRWLMEHDEIYRAEQERSIYRKTSSSRKP